MTAPPEFRLDFDRVRRVGSGEAILCAGKTPAQIDAILTAAADRGAPFLLTRLEPATHAALAAGIREALDYHPPSLTAFLGDPPPSPEPWQVAIVTGGTSDVRVAHEAARTLLFNGIAATLIFDVGVAGLWRLTERLSDIDAHPVVIAIAGLDAALPTVLAGLVPGAVIAVPTSTGYGMARGGETALASCLVSCAPGLVVVNIDNGYGAAIAALRILRAGRRLGDRSQAGK